jgi:hypothetical protein
MNKEMVGIQRPQGTSITRHSPFRLRQFRNALCIPCVYRAPPQEINEELSKELWRYLQPLNLDQMFDEFEKTLIYALLKSSKRMFNAL